MKSITKAVDRSQFGQRPVGAKKGGIGRGRDDPFHLGRADSRCSPHCVSFEPGETMRILIVEDNEKVAALLAKRLTENLFVVDLAKTVDEAMGALEVVDYDLVVLDLTLPDGDGVDVLRALRKKRKAGPGADRNCARRCDASRGGVESGRGRLHREAFLVGRVACSNPRDPSSTPTNRCVRDGAWKRGARSRRIVAANKRRAVEIARREFEVLAALFRSHGRIIPRERLEEAIYSFDVEVTPNAIEATISRLRRRLQAEGATIAITAMRGLGYVLGEPAAC